MKFGKEPVSLCHSVTSEGDALKVTVIEGVPPAIITNSICFSPDGKTMYHTNTPTKVINAYDYSETGQVSNSRVFYSLVEEKGPAPDGSIVNSKGELWSCQWGGSRV